jgi:hypothetical protein
MTDMVAEELVGSVEQRRARLVRRHLLEGSGTSTVEVAGAVLALHATDPATVYLSTLARARTLTLDDVATALYDDRTLVRLMAMRRTLFVVPQETVPVVHHAASVDVAATIRRTLVKQLRTLPTDPELPDDVEAWLVGVEAGVQAAAADLGAASGAQLSAAEPRLRTALLPTTDKAYDVRRTVTTQVLTLMGAEGRIVRGRPLGTWTSRQHTWEPAVAVWPQGIAELTQGEARAQLVERYLARFGPATQADVAWWTGWPLGVTRKAVAQVGATDVGDGLLVLPDDTDPVDVPPPAAALLPALDPTPMGWKQRDWFLPEDSSGLYDRYGNVGPTVWWAGEVVGGWATDQDGRVVTRLLADRGDEAAQAVETVAEQLEARLGGAVVTPSFPTPLARELGGSLRGQ